MRLHISSIICMVIIIIGASIVGRVIRAISVDHSNSEANSSAFPYADDKGVIGHESESLLWFIQISDLHLSIFHDPSRDYDLRRFCNVTIDAINPLVVLASGDLTDGKTKNSVGSRQYETEWKAYSNILKSTGVLSKTIWLDIRGNHDNFDVPALKSSNNFYQHYSIQGKKHPRSYMHVMKKGSESVAFIAVDACLLPGPKRPFNFIGVLTAEEIDALNFLGEESKKYNYTIWFGHYPTSCILSPNPGIRKVMENGFAYLCGHLHTLGGFARNLYTRQHTGSLELELGDWKDDRIFRVLAIDHGLFSFTDVELDDWPIILITNPKDSLFAMADKEPLHLIPKSTHVRALVWSTSPILKVRMKLDDGSWVDMHHANGPLFVARWNPHLYQDGMHTIKVHAIDSNGEERTISQEFSLDGSQASFSLTARVILMSNVSLVFQFFFGVSICLAVIPLCVVHLLHHLVLDKKMNRPRLQWSFCRSLLRKLWIVASVNKLFWPLILSALYMPVGPWFIGEILDGHIGVAFAWGILVYSSYLPGSLTYAYGFLQMMTFHIPITLLTAFNADARYQSFFLDQDYTLSRFIWINSLFAVVIFIQVMNAYFFLLAYGTMAFIMGPLRTWSVIFGIYLWRLSSTLQPRDLSSVVSVWKHKSTSPEVSQNFLGESCNMDPLSKEDSKESNSSSSSDVASQQGGSEPEEKTQSHIPL